MAEILVWLPESKYARITWNTTVNLTLVERVIANILYIKDTQYFVDKMYAENIQDLSFIGYVFSVNKVSMENAA